MFFLPNPKIVRSFRHSISLKVTRDGDIVVHAPHFVSLKIIENFLQEKNEWIYETLEKITSRKIKKKEYAEGEMFYYLGLQRKLRFYNGIEIKIAENTLFFPKVLQFRIQKELQSWFMQQAREKITQRVAYHNVKMQTQYSGLLFSDTKTKWGTCFPDNSLQFNWRLIMAPILVIDYVIIHELSHTTEKNHSASFWRRVGRFTPAYRQHRKWLNQYGQALQI